VGVRPFFRVCASFTPPWGAHSKIGANLAKFLRSGYSERNLDRDHLGRRGSISCSLERP
jgi:hypothetical protein